MLEPLRQWICDRCKQVIEKPEDGWVHWRWDRTDQKAYDFSILHHMSASPLAKRDADGRPLNNGCYPESMEMDMHLDRFIGPRGLVDCLSMLDVGPHHDPEGRELGRVRSLREWVEFVRRLQLPHYEEARLLFQRAAADGYFDGANEIWIYLPENLRGLVERYGD